MYWNNPYIYTEMKDPSGFVAIVLQGYPASLSAAFSVPTETLSVGVTRVPWNQSLPAAIPKTCHCLMSISVPGAVTKPTRCTLTWRNTFLNWKPNVNTSYLMVSVARLKALQDIKNVIDFSLFGSQSIWKSA